MDHRRLDLNRKKVNGNSVDQRKPGVTQTAGPGCSKPFQPIQLPSISATENIPDVVFSLDAFGIILTINRSVEAYGFSVEEVIGQPFGNFVHPDDWPRVSAKFLESMATKKDHVRAQQFRVITKDKEIRWIETNSIIRFSPDGDFIDHEGVCRDITGYVNAQNALLQDQVALEEQVKIRTAELVRANEELQKEILERRDTERQLREREVDLEMEKANLQETNTALKVLLKRRDADKQDFEEQVMFNVKALILPYLDKLKATRTDADQEAFLSILETNLDDITGAFSRRLSLEFHGLTASELTVANFIRQGKKTREIASLLGLSDRTIEAYRFSIRRKLRINNKKANLRTLLLSMQ